MKKWALTVGIIIGGGTIAGCVWLAFVGLHEGGEPRATNTRYSSEKSRMAKPGSPENLVVKLAEQGSPDARRKLVQSYADWIDRPGYENARRAIIAEFIRNEPPAVAIRLVLQAVRGDKTALAGDELLPLVEDDVSALWEVPGMFQRGRDLLLLEKNLKAKQVLAASLARYVESPKTSAPVSRQEKYELASDFIGSYFGETDPVYRNNVLKFVARVASPDVAEVLADPANAANSRLARRSEDERDSTRAHKNNLQ